MPPAEKPLAIEDVTLIGAVGVHRIFSWCSYHRKVDVHVFDPMKDP
jgi:hypothetical protein